MFEFFRNLFKKKPEPEVLGPPEPPAPDPIAVQQRAWHASEAAKFRALQASPDFDAESMKQKFAAQAEVHEEAIRLLDQHIIGS